MARSLATPLTALILTACLPPLASCWGNGSSESASYPYYEIHDAVAEYAYLKLRECNETMARWITDFYLNPGGTKWGDYGYSYGAGADCWLGYTDDPDSHWRDWENHLYEVHGFRRGAPSRVQELYGLIVEHLARWVAAGMPYRSEDEHLAAYYAGLLSHYLADVSQFGHTDYTHIDHSHPAYDPAGRTFHAYYDSESITDEFISAIEEGLRGYEFDITVRVKNVSELVVDLAKWVNARDGKTVNGVGFTYWWALTKFVNNYNSGVSYLGARGYNEELFSMTLENVRAATGNLTWVLYSAFKDAEERAASTPPAAAAFTVSDLAIAPHEAKPSEPITIRVKVANIGKAAGTYEVKLIIDGRLEATKRVALAPSESEAVAFTVVRNESRTYNVEVDGLKGEFTVKRASALPLKPEVLALIALAVVAAIFLLWALRRWRGLRG